MIPNHTIRHIETIICRREKINSRSLHDSRKIGRPPLIRHIIMFFALEAGHTLEVSGNYFRRDHATVSYAQKTINGYCDIDSKFKEKIEGYRKEINQTEESNDNRSKLADFMIPRQKLTGYKIQTI